MQHKLTHSGNQNQLAAAQAQAQAQAQAEMQMAQARGMDPNVRDDSLLPVFASMIHVFTIQA